ncbi:hypothetical protein BaRGS_00039545 [Batillaria attramentaria]|uniref:Uncharacterized protein n=1 Tax=Batillaria attramentaria TaxID=370345 RepID=A0ABD0J2Y8_9CAEN
MQATENKFAKNCETAYEGCNKQRNIVLGTATEYTLLASGRFQLLTIDHDSKSDVTITVRVANGYRVETSVAVTHIADSDDAGCYVEYLCWQACDNKATVIHDRIDADKIVLYTEIGEVESVGRWVRHDINRQLDWCSLVVHA